MAGRCIVGRLEVDQYTLDRLEVDHYTENQMEADQCTLDHSEGQQMAEPALAVAQWA